jgi:uncharacterized phage protein (TIGR02220 family)/predicted phage replisome organizer
MADVKWIKLAVGLPNNRQLNQIRKIPNGDSIALMYIYLLCLAGEVNESGLIYLTPEVPYTDEMLATEFRMDLNTVRLGLDSLRSFGLIEIVDNIISLPTWEKWQAVDKLTEIRDKTRKRVAKHREKQKALQCNVTVTQCNAIDIDIDKEKELDKEIYISIVDYLNEKSGSAYRAKTPKTQKLIEARLNEGFTEEDFKVVIDKKCAEWIGTEWEKYLRPETLFGNKFEAYLNAKTTVKQNTGIPTNSAQDDLDDLF